MFNLFAWFRSQYKPKNLFTGGGSFIFDLTSSGNQVNSHMAMQMSTVYACVSILSEAKEAYVNSCKVWNEKYLIPYIEKEDENYYFLNYKKAEKEG